MYDMAKRSLAFTVATGGLLLTGTGYAPADAAVGFGTLPGPAQAQGSAAANQASPTSVSTPISVRGPESARAAVPVIAPQRVHVLTPQDPRSAGSGAAAAASSTVKNSPGILSGNTVQIPIYLGLNLCSNQVDAAAIHNDVAGSTCGGSGAAGGSNAGSSATASTTHSGGILSGNTVQAPINIPINACGNQVVAIGSHNKVGGGTCGTGGGSGSGGNSGGSSATAVTDHSGGILSGNIIQAPVNVPVNACGDQVNVIAIKDKTGGTSCETGGAGNGSGGSSATAVTNHSGGIGSGITLQAPINVPVNACGDQATVVGFHDNTGGATCANAGGGSSALSATMNSGGIASAISGQLPINVPVEACGDQAEVGALHDTTDAPTCIGPTAPTSTEVSYVSNSGGILSGNQASLPINVPVIACGDQVSAGYGNTTGTPTCSPTPPAPTPSSSVTPSTSPTPICQECGTPTPTPTVTPSMSASGTPTPITCPACATGTPSPTKTTPGGGNTTPPGGPGAHPAPGSLAHTGGAEGIALAVGAGALLVGAGVRTASKRRSGGNRSH